jgi:hypothetical protein
MFSVIFCQLKMTVSIVECHIFQVCIFYLFPLKGRVWWWTGDCDIEADGSVWAGVIDEGWG